MRFLTYTVFAAATFCWHFEAHAVVGDDVPSKDPAGKSDSAPVSEEPTSPESKVKVSTKTKRRRDYNRPSGVGTDVYVGAIFGTSSTSAELGDGEPKRSGYQLGVRSMVAINSGSFGISGGAGWFSNTLSAKSSETDKFSSLGEDDIRRKKDVKSSGFFLEFFPHFRPNLDFQIGPVAQIGMAPYRLYLTGEDHKAQTIFAGAMAAVEMENNEKLYRFGFQYLIDVNIETRSIQNILGSIDVGFLIRDRFTRVVEKRRTEKRREVVEKVVEKPVEKKVVSKQVTLVFDQQMVNFVTSKAELLPASLLKLQNLAKFLLANRLLWSKVIVEGHTDRRGEYQYNMKLSLDRAISVGQALTRSGVDSTLITWQGLGPSRPIDVQENEMAWARNRRVEIKFDGVTDEAALRNGVNQAMKGAN